MYGELNHFRHVTDPFEIFHIYLQKIDLKIFTIVIFICLNGDGAVFQ